MPGTPALSIGACSEAGRKGNNQDACAWRLPEGPELAARGALVAVADGIGSSRVSGLAARSAVASLLADYYATPASWPVRQAVQRVLEALNAWLYAQNRAGAHRYRPEQGQVCTLDAVVVHGATAHLFHVGDGRAHLLRQGRLEPLTEPHRAPGTGWLTRALGMAPHLEIDHHTVPLAPGDRLLLSTDGVHEHLGRRRLEGLLGAEAGAGELARRVVQAAWEAGSADHLTAAVIQVRALPDPGPGLHGELASLPPPPPLAPGGELDGYRILEQLHGSERGQVWLAEEAGPGGPGQATGRRVVIKVPAPERARDQAYLEGFLLEEWVGRRLRHPHLVRALPPPRRSRLYLVMEHVPGQTLAELLRREGRLPLARARELAVQIGRGLQAMHRAGMVHRDLRPANVMVGPEGAARLLDYGAVRVAGLEAGEAVGEDEPDPPPGALQHTAPECLLGEPAGPAADVFALGLLLYQMLTGALPYGASLARCRSRRELRRLRYRPARERVEDLPPWVDQVLARAVALDPRRRHAEVAELVHELLHPPAVPAKAPPLLQRDPARLWQGLSLALAVALLGALWLIGLLLGRP